VFIGIMLVSFYAGVLLTFDYGFHFNLVLTALYYLPFDAWFSRPAAEASVSQEPQTERAPTMVGS
jgi:hypothetical protein